MNPDKATHNQANPPDPATAAAIEIGLSLQRDSERSRDAMLLSIERLQSAHMANIRIVASTLEVTRNDRAQDSGVIDESIIDALIPRGTLVGDALDHLLNGPSAAIEAAATALKAQIEQAEARVLAKIEASSEGD